MQPKVGRKVKPGFEPFARLELVADKNGVLYVDDSKFTNANSAWYALTMTRPPIVWVLLSNPDISYEILKPLVADKVKAIVIVGQDYANLKEQFGCKTISGLPIKKAVSEATKIAPKGTTVLFSPTGYIEGFKEAVLNDQG
jgi:UDP-N-acetylmuramoylalanine--D-glutamate ligase